MIYIIFEIFLKKPGFFQISLKKTEKPTQKTRVFRVTGFLAYEPCMSGGGCRGGCHRFHSLLLLYIDRVCTCTLPSLAQLSEISILRVVKKKFWPLYETYISGSEISCRIQISHFRSCRMVRLKTHQKKPEKNAFFAICDHFFHTNFFPNDLKLDIVLNPNEDYLHYKFCANRSTFSTPKVVKSASKIVCTIFAEP